MRLNLSFTAIARRDVAFTSVHAGARIGLARGQTKRARALDRTGPNIEWQEAVFRHA